MNTTPQWNPVWDSARQTWVEQMAGLQLDRGTGSWVPLSYGAGVPCPPARSGSLAYRAGRSTAGPKVAGAVVVAVGLLAVAVLGSVVGKVGNWISDTVETNGAEDMAAGDCFSPSFSEMISASFDRVDCADAEPYWDMKVLWVDHASSLEEADELAYNCSAVPYVPDDQETLDATDGAVICAETVTGSGY